MSKFSPVHLVGFLFLLQACSPMQPQVQAEQPAPAEPLAPILPKVSVTPTLMYDVLVAEMAGQQGELRIAASKYLDVAKNTRDPRVAKRTTHIAIYNRDFAMALQAARLWVDITPKDPEALQSVAALLIRNNQLDEAVDYLKRLMEQSGEGPGLLIAANLLAREDNKQKALGVMRRLTAGYKDNPHALYAHAHLAHTLGDHAAALELVDRLLARAPQDRNGLLLRASVLQQLERKEEAITTLENAVRLFPEDVELRLGLARTLVEVRRLAEARSQFEAVTKLRPDDGDVLYALGLLALEANETEAAEGHFKRVLDVGERQDEALFALGQIEELRKNFAQAVQYYSGIGEGDTYLRAQMRIAGIVSRQEGLDQALAYLDSVPLSDPADRLNIFLAKAELLRDAARHQEAFGVYDQALEEFAGNADLLYGRAMTAEKLGRIDLLERDLKAILEQDPENVQALNALGYTLADRTNRHQEAYDYISRAIAQEPNDPAILDSMGWVLYRMGRHAEAVEYLRRALATQEDGEIAAHLGEVLWTSGQQNEARQVWEAADRFAPDHDVLKRTRERLLK